MKVGAIVQARMSSQRLPGKVLRDLAGKPMLEYLTERLARCESVERFVVATSLDESDNALADFCTERDIFCYRGQLENVASRFYRVLTVFGWDGFVRVNGDSPLLDPQLIDEAVAQFQTNAFDLVTNVFPRSYPAGQSVEVVRGDVFLNAYSGMSEPDDFEHVTRYFYRHPNEFRIFNLDSGGDYNRFKLCIDTEPEFDVLARIIGRMDRPHADYGWQEILSLYHRVTGS